MNSIVYTIKNYIDDISKYPLLTEEEEQNIGNILYNIRNNKYVMLNKYDIPVYNYRKLFGNLSFFDIDKDILSRLKSILNNSKNTILYTKLNKYLDLIIKNNNFINKNELIKYFNIKKFKKENKDIILNELDNYIIYLKARQKMIESNFRLVFSIVPKYFNEKIDDLELINEGNIGLILAVDKYNINKGYRFSTYASRVIDSFVRRTLPKYNQISISQFISKEIYDFNKKREELENETNKKYSIKELSEIFNIDYKRILSYLIYSSKLISLETPLNDEDNLTLLDVVPYNENSFNDFIETDFINNSLELLLNKLSDKEREIILFKNGINKDNKTYTNIELSKIFNVSHQRIQQIEKTAMEKLKKYSIKKEYKFIKDYL